jgi:hypothetical protein
MSTKSRLLRDHKARPLRRPISNSTTATRRRLPSLLARGLHPSKQHQLAAKWFNAFGSFFGRVSVNHNFIKRVLQCSMSRQQNHVPRMQDQCQQHITSGRHPHVPERVINSTAKQTFTHCTRNIRTS